MTQELKACPFCGGDAHIYTPHISIGDDITDVDWMRAQCTKCGASRGFARFRDHNRQSDDFKRASAEVIAAWNTRIESGLVAEALLAVVNATRAYLPPDGISEKECINRILEATDNPAINPIIARLEASK